MKEVTMIKAVDIAVRCPYCEEFNDGWYGDPRGEVTTCEWCEKEFKIHQDADIEMEC